MSEEILRIALQVEADLVLARQRARQFSGLLGFDAQDQTRIATAVSEIARNAFRYAGGGAIEFSLEGATPPQVLVVRVVDRGPGIESVERVLRGEYRSPTGMGLGIVGARRLMDGFAIDSEPGRGTTVTLRKLLPRRAGWLSPAELASIVEALRRDGVEGPHAELQRQNRELLAALEELERRQQELAALNRELEDTNRGVVALYAELDERADHLRRADEIKSRFLSNMTHEFRTPVNSIQALARMLLERLDGELTPEQERQVSFIRKAADGLSELVNDLLDIAKVEAGKTTVRAVDFEVGNLFGALRGMLRPLLVNDAVALVFEDPPDIPPLHTDEAKVSQIIRNFVSNALKYTERGVVRVAAELSADGRSVWFTVEDSGIGIAPEDQERIFQEFVQLDSPLQRRIRGTGLGLPLCRKLVELLGGEITVESELGRGSTFRARIPRVFGPAAGPASWNLDESRMPVLVVEDEPDLILLYDRYLAEGRFQTLGARSLREAREALTAFRPRAILLDVLLTGEDGWSFLTEIRRDPATHDLPVVVLTSVEDERKALALGASAYIAKPVDRHRLLHTLVELCDPSSLRRILLVDDEEIFRYVLRQHLMAPTHRILEAATVTDALRIVREGAVDLICLDLHMPDGSGSDLLERFEADLRTIAIPVVVVTATPLDEPARRALLTRVSAVLSKDDVSRERLLEAVEQAFADRARDGRPVA